MTAAENTELGANIAGVIRAIIRSELSDQEKARGSDYPSESRVGRPWTAEEDQQLERELLAVATLLAALHHRKVGGIMARAKRLLDHVSLRE